VNDATDFFWLGGSNPAVDADTRMGKAIAAAGGGQMVKGFYYAERKSNSDLKIYRNNTLLGSNATATTPVAPNLNLYAWARNNNGVAAGYNFMHGSFLSVGMDLSAQERSDFYACVQTLQTNLGRAI
jgi:hypothetical protein